MALVCQQIKAKMALVTGWHLRNFVIFGSGLAVSYCSYLFYRFLKKRQLKSIDEGFEDVSKIEESPVRKVLFLGLTGSGKSTIVKQITSQTLEKNSTTPTQGFNITRRDYNNVTLDIWEFGGCEKVRPYWCNFLSGTDVLVLVVDSADVHNLSVAVTEVHRLLGDEQLHKVPVLLLAHKQDLPGAMSPKEVADALDIRAVPSSKHVIKVLGSQCPPHATQRHPSMVEVDKTLLHIVGG